MEIERCWMHYLKAEQLMEQGHWPEAQRLYGDVLTSLPHHIQDAAYQSDIKPCQFACLLACRVKRRERRSIRDTQPIRSAPTSLRYLESILRSDAIYLSGEH